MTTILQWLSNATTIFFAQRNTIRTEEPWKKVRSSAHTPGRMITCADGATYQVQRNGSWKWLSERRFAGRVGCSNSARRRQ